MKCASNNPILENFAIDTRFYFVHGYYVNPKMETAKITTTSFGHEFCSIVNQENLWGVQFHPEKSHKFGSALLKNFGDLKC
jgi:glutamine amidotransferase